MTIPDNLYGLDYSLSAEPFCVTPGRANIDLLGMYYSLGAEPCVSYNWSGVAPPATNYGLFAFFLGI